MIYKNNYFSLQLKIMAHPMLALKTEYVLPLYLSGIPICSGKKDHLSISSQFPKSACHVQKAWWHVLKINQFTWMHFEIILSGDSLQIIFAYIYISKTDIFFAHFFMHQHLVMTNSPNY